MQLFRFDTDVARPVADYGSMFRLSRLLLSRTGEVRVDVMYLGPHGLVGHHQAGLPQLFAVIHGEGWVQGTELDRVPIAAGQAAFWTSGEWHGAGTDGGMTAVVIQAAVLDPASLLTAE